MIALFAHLLVGAGSVGAGISEMAVARKVVSTDGAATTVGAPDAGYRG
jgi:hypothetical protein